jgi:hypothetical protein
MGNWINKEWAELNSGDEGSNEVVTNTEAKSKANILKRKISNLVSNTGGEQPIEYSRVNTIDSTNSTPIASKLIMADFDPRSPSSGIIRTPICYMPENSESKKPNKFICDPRSPTNEYNRTPIHINTLSSNNFNNQIDLNTSNSENLNESLTSQDSSLIMSDSSVLLQQGIHI